MPQITANDLYFEYESFGDESSPVVLLIMGLGAQLCRWPMPFCQALIDRGFRLIRFDNRDCGLSSKLDQAAIPDIGVTLRTGAPLTAPYTLDDMATDCIALLDALAISRAHLVGASMGGAIGQIVAARYPQRVLSLTCMMTTSGHPDLPPPTREAAQALFAPLPATRDRESLVEDALQRQLAVASPRFPSCPQQLREAISEEHVRSFHPRGVARHLAAFLASDQRRDLLQTIRVPTLVIHGADDPLIPVACGYDVAAHIPGAELRVIDGMGHDLPVCLSEMFADAIAALARRVVA